MNRFSHFRRLADPTDKTVVVPNHDTLYSTAWLNLAQRSQLAAAQRPAVPDPRPDYGRRRLRRVRKPPCPQATGALMA